MTFQGAPEHDVAMSAALPGLVFVTLAAVWAWQASYASGGHQPWNLDADQTAPAFTQGYLGFTQINKVAAHAINRLARRAVDVERLYAAIQKSPSPEKTGEIVLKHIGDYDDDFFEALGIVIAHDKGCLRLSRAQI